jgi:hypothetical protein
VPSLLFELLFTVMQSQNLLIVPSRANDLSKSRKLLALPRICVLTLKVLVALLRADLLTGQAIKYVPGVVGTG